MENPTQIRTEGLSTRKGLLRKRTRPAVAYILHTTGVGPYRRVRSGQFKTILEAVLHVYAKIMKASPHVVIAPDGTIAEVTPHDLCAWHVGGKGAKAYRKINWATPRIRWWRSRFFEYQSPFEFCDGKLWQPYDNVKQYRVKDKIRSWWYMKGASCNANTRGIEFIPPDPKKAGAAITLEQLDSAAKVLRYWSHLDGIPLNRETIFTHSEVHPLSRTNKFGPWDTRDSMLTVPQVLVAVSCPVPELPPESTKAKKT
jgi:hypothetical protein